MDNREEKCAALRPTMLMILDGFGLAPPSARNALSPENIPFFEQLLANYPHTELQTSGRAVGLPEGQMGNSEVGHLNIGAGRIVKQSLTRIDDAIESGEFFANPALEAAALNIKEAKGQALSDSESEGTNQHSPKQSTFHIMGLIGPGGVHCSASHITALAEFAKRQNLDRVYIHAFLDGRDTPPSSALGYVRELESCLEKIGVGKITSVAGRYYAMDRDRRWERIEKAYDALTSGTCLRAESAEAAIEAAYARGETDEFVPPTLVCKAGTTPVRIEDGDSIVFANFRPDRARELTRVLTEADFDGFERKRLPKNLCFVTMTEYDASLANVHIAFPQEEIRNTLGEYISSLGKKQLRIAETEKYAHVTFFFNGGIEEPYPGESRILVPSPKVATYDLKPEMSAYEVTERAAAEIESGTYDLIILNFANMDMVGHTGVTKAAVKAAQTIDKCVAAVCTAIDKAGGQLLITADHGNAEEMATLSGEPITAHSLNPVPLVLYSSVSSDYTLADGGLLSDLAPTLLDMMGLPKPAEMTGQSLLRFTG